MIFCCCGYISIKWLGTSHVLSSCFFSLNTAPWVVGPGQCCHRRRTDAVAAHVNLLGDGEGLAVSAVGDVVVR